MPAGSLLSLSVPSGEARNIIVFGFAADSTADCLPSSTQTPVASKLSAPRVLGTKLTSLAPGDVEVTIDLDFDTATTFDTCSQWTDINTAPPILPTLAFDLSTQTVSESAGLVTVGIGLSEAASQSINLPFTVSGSATGAGTDHDLAGAGNLVINAGSTTASLTFNIVNDTSVEASETVVISLQTPTGATLDALTTHTVTISDNDTPAISLANSNLSLSTSTIASSTSGTATLTIRDATNNPIPTASGHTIAFSATGGTSTVTFGATTDNGNGTYTASFSGITAGSATTVNATINGSAITSTLPTVTVTPGGISTSQSLITVASASITSGSATTLTLTSRDANGNTIGSGGATVIFTRSGGVTNGTIAATTDNGNGTYTASFTGTIAGSATTINATINGVAVTGTLPTITVTPGAISTTQSTITVGSSSVTSGASTTLTLTVRDANSNPLTSGGATVLFTKSGGTASGTISATTDNGNGTYSATFSATTAGTATTINATINAGAVTGTLPTIAVTPGAISTSQSTITASSANITAGGTSTITLITRDALGNSINSGGAAIVFSRSGGGANGTFGTFTDLANGSYTVVFTGTTAGTATTINATINGTAVTGTLPTITVNPGAVSLSQSTVAIGSATIAAGSTSTITLTARDAYGNTLAAGGDTVGFSLSGGSANGNITSQIDNGNGTYTATFTGTTAGSGTMINATINAGAVTGARPTISVIPGAISTSQSLLAAGLASIAAGTVTTITLTARDNFNNNLTNGGATVVFSKSGGTSNGNFGGVTDNGDGTYSASFTGTTAGSATNISATINAGSFTGTQPTIAVTPGAISTSQSQITVGSASIVSGTNTSLTLISRDNYGNLITTGGAIVAFSYSGGFSTGTFGATTDNADGTYIASFNGLAAGTGTTINATINGSNFSGTLPVITVLPGAASLSASEVMATFNSIQLGDITTIIMTTKDAYENFLTTGGLSVAFSQGGGFGTFGPMTDMGDGTYEIDFTGTTIGGPAIISATIGGQTVAMTTSINVTPMVLSVNPVYPINGPKWNDYVSFSNSAEKPWNQTDASCTGSEAGYYDEPNGCVHAGILREVLVPSETSCANLTITDALVLRQESF